MSKEISDIESKETTNRESSNYIDTTNIASGINVENDKLSNKNLVDISPNERNTFRDTLTKLISESFDKIQNKEKDSLKGQSIAVLKNEIFNELLGEKSKFKNQINAGKSVDGNLSRNEDVKKAKTENSSQKKLDSYLKKYAKEDFEQGFQKRTRDNNQSYQKLELNKSQQELVEKFVTVLAGYNEAEREYNKSKGTVKGELYKSAADKLHDQAKAYSGFITREKTTLYLLEKVAKEFKGSDAYQTQGNQTDFKTLSSNLKENRITSKDANFLVSNVKLFDNTINRQRNRTNNSMSQNVSIVKDKSQGQSISY